MLEADAAKLIAKFSSTTDPHSVVRAEFAAMRLAARLGLEMARVDMIEVAGKEVLLVERFDRVRDDRGWQRRAMVSALTLFELDELSARHGSSYPRLAELVRRRFTNPTATLNELFGRMVFNILVGNTDDHARNHSAFWDGESLSLTPGYDVAPGYRHGNEASQAMLITETSRASRLANCIETANAFNLTPRKATEIIAGQIDGIHAHWSEIAEEARLSAVDRRALESRVILNPSVFDGAPASLPGHPLA